MPANTAEQRPQARAGEAIRHVTWTHAIEELNQGQMAAFSEQHRAEREEAERMRKEMEVILARHTGRTEEQIEQDIERDKILTADMAKEYGIIDQVIVRRGEMR